MKEIAHASVKNCRPAYRQEISAGIERIVSCKNTLTVEQWEKLLNIAGKTPVTRTMLAGAKISTTHLP